VYLLRYGIADDVDDDDGVGEDGEKITPAFKLTVESGSYYEQGQVIVLLGENGTGKSTFIDMFSHWLTTGKADGGSDDRNTGGADNGGSKEGKGFVAIKRQHPLERARRVWTGSVKRFLEASPAGQSVHNRMFRLLVLKALRVEELMYARLGLGLICGPFFAFYFAPCRPTHAMCHALPSDHQRHRVLIGCLRSGGMPDPRRQGPAAQEPLRR